MPIKSSAALKILLGNGDSFSYASHSCVGERKTASKRSWARNYVATSFPSRTATR